MKKIILFISFYISLIILEQIFGYIGIGINNLLKLPPLGILYFKEIAYGIALLFSAIIPGILTAKIMIYSNYKFNINSSNNFLLYPALILILITIISATVSVDLTNDIKNLMVADMSVFIFIQSGTYIISILNENK